MEVSGRKENVLFSSAEDQENHLEESQSNQKVDFTTAIYSHVSTIINTTGFDHTSGFYKDTVFYVSAMARMSSTRLIVTRIVNGQYYSYTPYAQIIDTENKKQFGMHALGKFYGPHNDHISGITVMPGDQAAVSVTNTIYILSTSRDVLSTVGAIDVNGTCYGVGYANEKLVVSFGPTETSKARVEIRNLWGGLCSLINVENIGLMRFSNPTHLCVASEEGTDVIYISDQPSWDTNLLTKVSLEGRVLATYNDWGLTVNGPITATGDGHVLMCTTESHSIHLLHPNTMATSNVVLTDGISRPSAICFSPEENTLFVSCYGSKCTIEAFKVKN